MALDADPNWVERRFGGPGLIIPVYACIGLGATLAAAAVTGLAIHGCETEETAPIHEAAPANPSNGLGTQESLGTVGDEVDNELGLIQTGVNSLLWDFSESKQ